MNIVELSKLSCLSWNVKGLITRHRFGGKLVRKFETFTYILSAYNWPDFVFLQETHLVDSFRKYEWEKKLNKYRCYFNYGEHMSKGTAVLIKTTVNFEVKNVNQDINGNFTI